MKKLKSIIIKILIVLLVTVLTVCCIIVSQGYNMYKSALNEKSLEIAVEEIRNTENYTTLENLPQIYIDAVVSVEDHRFFEHGAIDITSLGRAVINNIKKGKLTEGGSTITQQLAKNMYFSLSKRLDRKVAEYFTAREIEKNYSKNEILEMYFNTIYFGSGYYCIYDASMGYFGKAPSQLTDYEAIMLAGIPNAPSVYSLNSNPELAKQRQRQVVEKMLKYNKLDKEMADKILSEQ